MRFHSTLPVWVLVQLLKLSINACANSWMGDHEGVYQSVNIHKTNTERNGKTYVSQRGMVKLMYEYFSAEYSVKCFLYSI